MEKRGIVEAGVTPCDICGRTSTVVTKDGSALCSRCDKDDLRKEAGPRGKRPHAVTKPLA